MLAGKNSGFSIDATVRVGLLDRDVPSVWAKLIAKIAEDFPLACPACGGDIRLIAFITDPARPPCPCSPSTSSI